MMERCALLRSYHDWDASTAGSWPTHDPWGQGRDLARLSRLDGPGEPKSLTLDGMPRCSSCMLVLLSACGFSHGVLVDSSNSDGGMTIDAPDAPEGFVFMDAPADARQCFGTFENICLTTLPTTDVTVDVNRDLNTDTAS